MAGYGPWTTWTRAECPVPDLTLVQVQQKSDVNRDENRPVRAVDVSWGYYGSPWNVVAYREVYED